MTSNGFLALCFVAMVVILAAVAIYTAVGNFLNEGYAAHEKLIIRRG